MLPQVYVPITVRFAQSINARLGKYEVWSILQAQPPIPVDLGTRCMLDWVSIKSGLFSVKTDYQP
jgi:hypothetical protein